MFIKRMEGCTQPVPRRESKGAAGYDLRASDVTGICHIRPGERKIINTGFAWQIPPGYVGMIRPRSGLAVREGLDVLAGVVDSDYRGEVKVLLVNHGHESSMIRTGDRVAQMVVSPVETDALVEVDTLADAERGDGGFGSTGVN